MITYVETSVFDSPAQTLVNTVNLEGIMGKGIAKEFKARYPEMFKEYRGLCDAGLLDIGLLHLWRGERRWVLNFPTKTTWRQPSKLEYVREGLEKFVATYEQLAITSISFPPLGCGNGNLSWTDVRPMMHQYLSRVDIPGYIHDVQIKKDFVPEHIHLRDDAKAAPEDFSTFFADIRQVLFENRGRFFTSGDGEYTAVASNDGSLLVDSAGKKRRIDQELLEEAWIRLRDRYLSIQNFPDHSTRALKSYVFPILAELPYVRRAVVRTSSDPMGRAEGLFIDREDHAGFSEASSSSEGRQEWLFQ